ncbi:phosphoribosyl-AMP cyclohydrolase [Emcibacteraceae bacterium]|jgi:phosphoribosyl-AMP cyclohydrolase|uniref:phosphoribosyl-AMP cyclohydrolase n=1 Tax=Pseudemcibacter sp. TaxID=2943293 RepID=UPI00230A3C23|nr:phosphoribosyl-AMP cyclohydrolase [Kordiimonadaceae bacterium]MDA7568354.1 phosphoribosyl-AMP cyclohydrolase [Emcibacteraceae bacterium]MDA9553942.1 phosphoribosyl-AMP cyclohydrolase [Emcibacteraceae bacterium]MDA9770822.1 phosphoribosyl-AMP cyclohydrolase [Emcibacteraceae bacterium]MDC1089972.1 phosphoribosyl-AMP cyclohydrolase [Emcibacteraceae bacterium]
MANTENSNSFTLLLDKLKFNEDSLIPAIAQSHDSHEVLMMAWMNRDAIIETLNTGRVCYYSRSRQKLWRKGESSGQIQTLKNFRVDCDADTLLLFVDQVGVACHTGRRSCFYEEVSKDGSIKIVADILRSPDDLYGKK